MSRIGPYLPYGVAVLARIGGRYEPYWPLFAVGGGCSGPHRWPRCAVLAVVCRVAWLTGRCLLPEVAIWPVSVAAMSRIGRYLPCGVAVLARIGGRHAP